MEIKAWRLGLQTDPKLGRPRQDGQRLPQHKHEAPGSQREGHFSGMTSTQVLCFLPTSAWRAGSPEAPRPGEQQCFPVLTADPLFRTSDPPPAERDQRGAEEPTICSPEDTVLPGQCRTDEEGSRLPRSQTLLRAAAPCYLCRFSHPPCSSPSSKCLHSLQVSCPLSLLAPTLPEPLQFCPSFH